MAEPVFDPHTDARHPSRRATHSWQARLQGAVMILILIAGMAEGIAALRTSNGRQRLADNASLQAFLSGRLAGAVNYVMAHDLPSGDTLSALGGIYRWRLFHAGGPSVSPGCGDWLFLTEEIRTWDNAEFAMAERADAMKRISDRLRARNVAVIFALVPDKARIEQAQLCGVRRPAQERGRYDAFIGMVHARGLQIVDLNQPFAGAADPAAVYLHSDTHWSQAGAALAARTIAAAVPPALFAHDYRWTITPAAVTTKRVGDLIRLMSLDHVPDFALLPLRPRPDMEHTETAVQVAAPADTGGLLDAAPALPVILLGSSYSVNSHFYEHLEQDLSTSIGQFAINGGGFSVAARGYFANAAWRDSPPRLIVWEIPERVVPQPFTPDEQAFVDGKDKSGIAK